MRHELGPHRADNVTAHHEPRFAGRDGFYLVIPGDEHRRDRDLRAIGSEPVALEQVSKQVLAAVEEQRRAVLEHHLGHPLVVERDDHAADRTDVLGTRTARRGRRRRRGGGEETQQNCESNPPHMCLPARPRKGWAAVAPVGVANSVPRMSAGGNCGNAVRCAARPFTRIR